MIHIEQHKDKKQLTYEQKLDALDYLQEEVESYKEHLCCLFGIWYQLNIDENEYISLSYSLLHFTELFNAIMNELSESDISLVRFENETTSFIPAFHCDGRDHMIDEQQLRLKVINNVRTQIKNQI